MSLEIAVHPGVPSADGLAVELWLRSRQRVQLRAVTLAAQCPQGLTLGRAVQVRAPKRFEGEHRVEVQLRVGEITPASVCCRAWLLGASEPLMIVSRVHCVVAYPGLTPELASCLDEVCTDHDEAAFQVFLGDFCKGVDPGELAHEEVERVFRELMCGEGEGD